MFTYNAYITKVYDGDTVTADIDLGFGIFLKKQRLRLLGINAPEIRGSERSEGLVSRDFLRDKILNKKVVLKTHKDKKGKYGRILAEIFFEDENINELLLSEGYAVKY